MTKTKIYMVKTGPYNPVREGMSKYQSYDTITTQQFSPGITGQKDVVNQLNIELFSGAGVIMCSTLRRCYETAQIITELLGVGVATPTELLNEVKFSMYSLATEEEYQREGSNIIRARFIDHFIADTLLETRKQLFGRVQGLFNIIRESYYGKCVVCVSHSFFMKLLSTYLKDRRLFEKPEILREYFDPTKKTFQFCESFSFYV